MMNPSRAAVAGFDLARDDPNHVLLVRCHRRPGGPILRSRSAISANTLMGGLGTRRTAGFFLPVSGSTPTVAFPKRTAPPMCAEDDGRRSPNSSISHQLGRAAATTQRQRKGFRDEPWSLPLAHTAALPFPQASSTRARFVPLSRSPGEQIGAGVTMFVPDPSIATTSSTGSSSVRPARSDPCPVANAACNAAVPSKLQNCGSSSVPEGRSVLHRIAGPHLHRPSPVVPPNTATRSSGVGVKGYTVFHKLPYLRITSLSAL